jgi:hypothetical protein
MKTTMRGAASGLFALAWLGGKRVAWARRVLAVGMMG